MSHTKGPWKATLDKFNSQQYIFSQTTGEVISRFENDDLNIESNAALLAVAPEMLALLEFLTNLHESGDLHERILTLVRKAKNEKCN